MGKFLSLAHCLVFLILVTAVAGAQDLPIDRQATRETVLLYRHLQTIAGRGFLFGHQDDLAYGVNWKYIPGRSDVKDVTGEYPALYGWELGRIELGQSANLDGVPFGLMKDYIREAYRRGGVITISWHLNNPLTGGTAWQPAPGTVASILPGGEKHKLYVSWLDRVAAFLGDLKGPNGEPIPVILRLFHELNGSWFWWGGKNCTPDELQRLWRFTVSYLRDEKHLHNLLYAYNTDRFLTEAAWLERYPGDEWVDIGGFDIYQAYDIIKNEDYVRAFEHDLGLLEGIAKAHGKIAALTEFGYNGLPDSSWWTGVFLPTLKKYHMAYAMAWRNAGEKPGGEHEFYVPYPGQVSAADFVRFFRDPQTFFQSDATKENLYR